MEIREVIESTNHITGETKKSSRKYESEEELFKDINDLEIISMFDKLSNDIENVIEDFGNFDEDDIYCSFDDLNSFPSEFSTIDTIEVSLELEEGDIVFKLNFVNITGTDEVEVSYKISKDILNKILEILND